ncbi:MAG: D-arabinono-1,4-lactone oxidase [Actinomycetia bacterium]|nr:D-arabinono-1,4-lactone oxidase [Actinomycetes bacterium]
MEPRWQNWGRNVTGTPTTTYAPRSTEEIAAVIARAAEHGEHVRPVGSGHSFTAIAAPRTTHLRLDHLSGILWADRDAHTVRVAAGTPLHELSPALERVGLAMINLGDIDRQTISGAVSTGTHGTGAALTGLAGAVRGLTLVTGDGSVRQIHRDQDPDLVRLLAVGLGAYGIVTELELDVRPAYRLRAVEQPEPLAAVLEDAEAIAEAHRHFEFYWFPHTERVLTKRNEIAEEGQGRPLSAWRERLDDHLLSNVAFEQLNRLVARRPSLAPRINQVSARALSRREFTDSSYRVFCTRRDVRFVESEYAIPRNALAPVLRELHAWIERSGEQIAFPVEVRFAAADEVALSTAYGRESAYVAVHQYYRRDASRYFAAFEAIVAEHDGRPHWGKMHSLEAGRLGELYPRFAEVVALREELDPARVFSNDYLDRVLGA